MNKATGVWLYDEDWKRLKTLSELFNEDSSSAIIRKAIKLLYEVSTESDRNIIDSWLGTELF